MNVTINRLDPNVPDPVESRRRAAGRFVRIAYATIVFGVLAFFVIYFGAPFVFLGGPGTRPCLCADRRNSFDRSRACRSVAGGGHSDRRDPRSNRYLCGLVCLPGGGSRRPEYDFAPAVAGYTCPKCLRGIVSGDPACEIVGTSARCVRCGKEMVVSPPPPPTSWANQN